MQILYEIGGELLVLDFDATVKELHSASAVATEHFVEEGVAITDHVRADRKRLSAECHVTNTPLHAAPGADGSVQALSLEKTVRSLTSGATVNQSGEVDPAEWDSNEETVRANVFQFTQEFDRVGDVHATLTALMDGGVEVTALTSLGQYDAMVIVDLGAPRDAENSNAVLFSLELVEIRKAVSETVASPDPLETRAERQRRRGAQAPEEPESEDDRSLAARLVEEQIGSGLIVGNRPNGVSLFR
ncbi:MAG: hypothetical protein KAT70_09065 [Thermoplasmata archaeon]|nr:hypothetical protein [Thermoplasmata archaeon]